MWFSKFWNHLSVLNGQNSSQLQTLGNIGLKEEKASGKEINLVISLKHMAAPCTMKKEEFQKTWKYI